MDNALLSTGVNNDEKISLKAMSILTIVTKTIVKLTLNIVMCFIVLLTFLFLFVFAENKINELKKTNLPPLINTYVVVSPSMVPTIKVQDAVVVARTKATSLKVGDIITFKSNDPRYEGYTITHRINEIIKADNGELMFRTKGDNNDAIDNSLVPAKNIYGKVVVKLPYLGVLQNVLISPIAIFLLFVLPCILLIIYNIAKRLKASDKKDLSNNSDIVVEVVQEDCYSENKIFINENGVDIEIQIL
ncbi:MAG: signal peptidase I [Bacilli bacterium]|nr:signal peptidase I [Bacilli bacterium]